MPKKNKTKKTELYTTSLFEWVFLEKEIFEFFVDLILLVILIQANMLLNTQNKNQEIIIFNRFYFEMIVIHVN